MSGSVIWVMEYTVANRNGTFSGTPSVVSGTDNGTGTAYDHIMTELSDIDLSGFALSSMLMCRLKRAAGADTYNADAALLEFDIHYKRNSAGSYLKNAKKK